MLWLTFSAKRAGSTDGDCIRAAAEGAVARAINDEPPLARHADRPRQRSVV